MNILLWTGGFWPAIGGIETHSMTLIRGLKKNGHNVTVVTDWSDKTWPTHESVFGSDVFRFPFKVGLDKLTEFAEMQRNIYKVMQNVPVDLIHANQGCNNHLFSFRLLQKRLSVPLVLTTHGLLGDQLLAYKETIHGAAWIACVSDYILQNSIQCMPHTHAYSSCIHNGIEIPVVMPAQLPVNPPVILCLGRLTEEKGYDLAVKSFAMLKNRHPQVKFVIAGEGRDRRKIMSLMRKLKLNDDIYFTGQLTVEQSIEWINRATMVVVPSRYESFGLVAVEAAMMARPVIACSVGGLQEIVIEGKTGLLAEPENPAALFQCMKYLIEHHDEAIAMGQAARARAISYFSVDRMITQYEAVYKRVLTGGYHG